MQTMVRELRGRRLLSHAPDPIQMTTKTPSDQSRSLSLVSKGFTWKYHNCLEKTYLVGYRATSC